MRTSKSVRQVTSDIFSFTKPLSTACEWLDESLTSHAKMASEARTVAQHRATATNAIKLASVKMDVSEFISENKDKIPTSEQHQANLELLDI